MTAPSPRALKARVEFYEKTGNIHPRSVTGRFNSWRWAMVWVTQIVFYGACWLQWNGRQALLFDIAERKFYIFGLVLWPQDGLLLALLLIISASALFLTTALAGRLFCGFACPQTVYTAIFRWIEEKVEGDHLARMRRDRAPFSPQKVAIKACKHALWLAIALWTGISFVGYFTPIRELLSHLGSLQLGPWEGFWVFFYTAFAYLQAGFAREMVCLHMCPYARFQGVMFDADTRTVSYDLARGEPRKPRGATAETKLAQVDAPARGDCVDCGLCVQVCPTGIDIRDGLQYQCINCGLCADACDDVMVRTQTPTGLIRFASERELSLPRSPQAPRLLSGLKRPRALVYLGTLLVFSALGTWMLAHRVPLQVDVLRDRHVLFQENETGSIENSYTLKIVNMLEQARTFRISVDGPRGARLLDRDIVQVRSGSVLALPLTVAADADGERSGAQPIHFRLEAIDGPATRVAEPSVFLLP